MSKFRNAMLLVVLLLAAVYGRAQTTTTQTTLSAAVSDASTGLVTVASATGITAATTALYVDQELMHVTAVNGTSISVRRGSGGIAASHASGARVFVGPLGGGPFIAKDQSGTCTSTNELYLPQINTNNGNVYNCINSKWVRGNVLSVENVVSGSGATATLTAAESGSLILLDRAAGIVFTLPAPTVGLHYEFLAVTSVTSNAYKFSTATQGTDFIVGDYVSVDTDTAGALVGFACNGSTHDNFSMNGTTTGGLIGTSLKLTAISTTLWLIEGKNEGSGTVATACATS